MSSPIDFPTSPISVFDDPTNPDDLQEEKKRKREEEQVNEQVHFQIKSNQIKSNQIKSNFETNLLR